MASAIQKVVSVSVPVRLLLTVALTGLIVALSVVPAHAKPGDSVFVWLAATTPPTIQKLMHLAAYSVLAFLWMWTLDEVLSRTPRIALALLLSVALGASLEWYQTMVPGRFGSVMDVVLNSIGSALGILAAVLLL